MVRMTVQPAPSFSNKLKEQIFNAEEVHINYAVSEINRQTLLLLHGITSNWQSFLALIPSFGENHQIFAMDLRGHGRSGRVKHGYRLVDYSTDVLQFVQNKLRNSTIILGHSFGALIAIHVAAKLPQTIRGIILLDPPLIYRTMAIKDSPWSVDKEAYQWFITAHDIMKSSKSIGEIENSLQHMFPTWSAKNRSVLAHRLSQTDPEVLGMLIDHQHMVNYDTDELLNHVNCPVLVFQGNRSRGAALTDEDAQYLQNNLKNCKVILLEDAGHNVHETHSQEVAEQVIGFLNTI